MKVSTTTKIKIRLVLSILIGWIILGAFISIYNHLLIESIGVYDFGDSFVTMIVAVTLAGLIGGGLIVFVLRDRFRRQPLGLGLLSYAATFTLLIALITLAAAFLYSSLNMDLPIYHNEVVQEVKRYMLEDYGYLVNLITWSTIAFFTVLALQVNDSYGQGVLKNMLLGRYHEPKQEQRIFMFLDLDSSTSIAESLGSIRYFKFQSKFFYDISRPIIESYGEIYQYVGDEIVVSWPLRRGIKKARALKCFFRIEDTIKQKAAAFEERFGLVPSFKAGLHCGEVTVGEIGSVKKEIIFSGDVLNTTSRMQDLCKELDVQFLVSKTLLDKMPGLDRFEIQELQQMSLKGKQNPVTLYSVKRKTADSRISTTVNPAESI